MGKHLAEEIRRMNLAARAVPELPLPAAQKVARFIVQRWERAGVTGWAKDAAGRPVPAPVDLQHVPVEARKKSPSGKALFICSGCELSPSPLPPRGACPGDHPFFAESAIASLIARGVLYAPRGQKGLPLPPEVQEDEEAA